MSPNDQLVGSPAGSNQTFKFDPWLVWVTFRRCWPWAIPAGAVLAAVAAVAVLYNFVPQYRAAHLLQANEDYLVFKGVMPTVRDLARTERQLFYNPIVLEPVLSDPALRDAPSLSDPEMAEENLRKNLNIVTAGTASRVEVTYTDTDRVAAAAVCNAVVESYLRQRDTFDNTRISNLERWLEPEIERWEQLVDERQRQVQKLSEATLGFAPGVALSAIENQSSLSLVENLRTQITELNVELSVMDAEDAMRKDALANQTDSPEIPKELVIADAVVQRIKPTEADITRLIDADPEVTEAADKVELFKGIAQKLEIDDVVRIRRDYFNEVKANQQEWEEKLETAKSAARERAVAKLDEIADEDFERRKDEAKRESAALQEKWLADRENERIAAVEARAAERENIVTKLSVLKQEYSRERDRLERFGGATAELQFAQEELSVASDVLRRLRDRVAAIRTERRQDGAVRTLASAVPPKAPIEAVPIKQLIAFSGASFLIPFLVGLLWELKVQRLTDSKAVESTSLAPVVGEVAKLPSGIQTGRSRRVFEESIDTLRANLFLSMDTKNTRSIAVASSMSAEGKSSVASQLCISIARASGETVLLVDADVRCPDQHEIFGLEMGPGLCGVLAGEVEMSEAVDKSLGELVHVIPAGRLNCSPHRLISEQAIRGFVDEALKHYSYVVFDTAPVLSAGETLAIASAVDSTLVCVMRDVSRMDNLTRTTRRLEAAGANVAGTVFSGVSSRQYAYRYGDYHYTVAGQLESN